MTEISDRGIDFLVDNVNNDMDEAKKYKDEINNLIDLLGVEISKIDDYQVNFYYKLSQKNTQSLAGYMNGSIY